MSSGSGGCYVANRKTILQSIRVLSVKLGLSKRSFYMKCQYLHFTRYTKDLQRTAIDNEYFRLLCDIYINRLKLHYSDNKCFTRNLFAGAEPFLHY